MTPVINRWQGPGTVVDSCSPDTPAAEICNGIDDHCNGQTDEGVLLTCYRDADGDHYGTPAFSTQACSAPAGYVADASDCNDGSAAVHPGATETCSSVDDNSDGNVDEGLACGIDTDNDGVPDSVDSCPTVANPDPVNTGGDPTKGNACDVPTDKDECKPTAWQTLTLMVLGNQGQCVAAVQSKKPAKPGK